jgi:acetate---CoA ligase (ADP-forming)
MLDAAGGIPCLRGTTEALAAIAGRTTWEAARTERLAHGPRRPGWPDLARDRTPLGHDPAFEAHDPGIEPMGAPGSAPGRVAAIERRPATILPERESLALLAAAGLSVVTARAVVDPDAAVAAAEAIGYPVVLKLDATGLAHKTEIGGVRLGLSGPDAVRAAAGELLARGARLPGLRGLLVEPQVASGLELIVGLRRDPQFGPIVIVGLGGILAEALDDVALELAPLTARVADAMLDRLRGAAILAGLRGRPAVDRAAIAGLIVGLGDLAWERPDLREVDLNPVIAGEHAAIAVDGLVVLAGDQIPQ